MAANDAVHAMFSTWALCENVLSLLPCADLIHSRRVCRMFKAVVDQNTSLQRSFFLQPRTSNLIWTITCQSALDVFKTDQLLAGPDMIHHIKTAMSEGKVAIGQTIFKFHPALRVARILGSNGIAWWMRQSVAHDPCFATYNVTQITFDKFDPRLLVELPAHSTINQMFLS
jgi:hypothetical protein